MMASYDDDPSTGDNSNQSEQESTCIMSNGSCEGDSGDTSQNPANDVTTESGISIEQSELEGSATAVDTTENGDVVVKPGTELAEETLNSEMDIRDPETSIDTGTVTPDTNSEVSSGVAQDGKVSATGDSTANSSPESEVTSAGAQDTTMESTATNEHRNSSPESEVISSVAQATEVSATNESAEICLQKSQEEPPSSSCSVDSIAITRGFNSVSDFEECGTNRRSSSHQPELPPDCEDPTARYSTLYSALLETEEEFALVRSRLVQLDDRTHRQALAIELHETERRELRDQLETASEFELKWKASEEQLGAVKKDLQREVEKGEKHDAAYKRTLSTIQLNEEVVETEHRRKLAEAHSQLDEERRKNETVTMKYAQSDHRANEIHSKLDRAESSLKVITQERETLHQKVKALLAEKSKAVQQLELEKVRTSKLNSEFEKAKEQISSGASKLKWTEKKLKTIQDSQSAETLQTERLTTELLLLREELSQHSTTETAEKAELTQRYSGQLAEVTARADSLQKQLDDTLMKYNETYELCQKMLEESKELSTVSEESQRELKQSQEALQEGEKRAVELQFNLEAAQEDKALHSEKYHEQMSYVEKLTSSCSALHARNASLQDTLDTRSEEVLKLSTNRDYLSAELGQRDSELTAVTHEVASLVEQLNSLKEESSEQLKELRQKLSDEQENAKISRRKYLSEVRNLRAELRKKLDSGHLSRASSQNSMQELQEPQNGQTHSAPAVPPVAHTGQQPAVPAPQAALNSDCDIRIIDDQQIRSQMLIEKVVSLQKQLHRKQEKVEFLMEHNAQLLVELQKKSKVIQLYVMRDQVGALASDDREQAKAALAQRGGSTMSSIYNEHSNDGNLTLGLSLEIGNKLQAVLEDALLQNVTLKESVDTLGHEISLLAKENRELKLIVRGGKS